MIKKTGDQPVAGRLEIGRATRPLGVQLPLASFLLAISVALVVGISFYFESERLVIENEMEDLIHESQLVEPLLARLYEESFSDVSFLSNTPPIRGIAKAVEQQDPVELNLWKGRLNIIFTEMLKAKPNYRQIRFIGDANHGRELVNTIRQPSGVTVVSDSDLQTKGHTEYYRQASNYPQGEVYFSKIELNREQGKVSLPHTPVLRVATPIHLDDTGEVFGIVIINIDFGRFMSHLKASALKDVVFYLSGHEGDYLDHPDASKTFGFELGQRYLMQEEFPNIRNAMESELPNAQLQQIGHQRQSTVGYYSRITLQSYGNRYPLLLLVLYRDEAHLASLQTLRNRSLLLGLSLAVVALGLAALAARRLIRPLVRMSESVQNYEHSGQLEQLPIHSRDETGVLARSFHNLLAQLEEKSQQHQVAAEQAQESTKLKSAFLANMSHEIRTPMNGVLGMLELLMRAKLSQQQHHYANLARSSARSLLSVIDDILDFSKIEAGKIELEMLDFDLRSHLSEFAETMAHKAKDKGLQLDLDLSQIEHSMVRGDPHRLRQILTNLVGNAIKFTQTGKVLIKASLRENPTQQTSTEAAPGWQLHCAVSDTGIGIPSDKLQNLFDTFTQVDASTTRQYGGTGLGLAITQQLCALMGGQITMTSEVGKGSTFEFFIELDTSDAPEPVKPAANIEPCKLTVDTRVLVVEDNAINQAVAKGELEELGVTVDIASNGLEALRALTDNPGLYHLILMDCHMPKMDGYEATRQIRSGAYPAIPSKIPIVAMTANAMKGDPEKCLSAGMDDYLAKPLDNRQLQQKLAQWLPKSVFAQIHSPSQAPYREIKNNPDHDIWDRATALKRVRGRKDRMAYFLQLFLNEMPERAKALEHMINREQLKDAEHLAHQIKGVAGNLGAHRLQAAANALELAARANQAERLKNLWFEFAEQYHRLPPVLEEAYEQLTQTTPE